MKSLSIIIPAFNEETAIASVVQRAVASAPEIKKELCLDFVEIILVNDGSGDKTLEYARLEKNITIITYAQNRGYGAAIKLGFARAAGAMVGFMDADGTCDPRFFIDLCKPILQNSADIVLGNRLTHGGAMPFMRKIGNVLYAELLQFLAHSVVHDTASGMRVMKREILPLLYPLPGGMHFTPAMSAKALFDPDIRIREIPMPYTRRIGKSKLHMLRDGIGFLRIILETAFAYRPLLLYNIFTVLCVLAALVYLFDPLFYYLRQRRIEDYMYYRLSAISLLGIVAAISFNIGIINHRITILRNRRRFTDENFPARHLGKFGVFLALCALGITHRGILSYLSEGKVYVHWVYILTGEFLAVVGLIFIFSRIVYSTVNFIKLINIEHCGALCSPGDFERTYACTLIRPAERGEAAP